MQLGLIPARGGSVRLPGKNIKIFAGRPLIAWTIIEALKSGRLDGVYVSTEDNEIAEIAIEYGAYVSTRHRNLASPTSSIYDVVREFIRKHEPDSVCLLQPTSPLRSAEDIDGTVDVADLAVSAVLDGPGPDGSVYVAPSKWLMLPEANWDDPRIPRYIIPDSRSSDINTIADFQEAEARVVL